MKSPCYLVTLSLESSDFQTFLKQYVILVPFGALIIAGRPKAALLFWFFGDFRCGALLFMVIHVIYKYKNR